MFDIRLDIVRLIAYWAIRRQVRRKAFWLAIGFPVLMGGLFGGMEGYLNRTRSKLVAVLYSAGSEAEAERCSHAVARPLLASDEKELMAELRQISVASLDDEIRQASSEIIRNELAAFIVLQQQKKTLIYGQPGSLEASSAVNRLQLMLLLDRAGASESEAESGAAAIRQSIEIRPPLIPGAEGRGAGGKVLSALLIALGGLYMVVLSMAMAPLFNIGSETSTTAKSRLEIELMAMSCAEIVTGKIAAVSLVGTGLLLLYAGCLFTPAMLYRLVPSSSALIFLLLAVPGVVLHAPVCIVLGLLSSDGKGPSPLQWAWQLLLMLAVPASAFAAQCPESPLVRVLALFPFTSSFVGVARSIMVPQSAWWEVPVGMTGMLVCSAATLAAAIRIFQALVMAKSSTVGIGELTRLIIDPRHG